MSLRIPDGTLIRFVPNPRRDDVAGLEQHTGKVAYYTTDGFYRVYWDIPNPRPDFFNTERVFRPDQIELMLEQHLAEVRSPDGTLLARFYGENCHDNASNFIATLPNYESGCYDLTVWPTES